MRSATLVVPFIVLAGGIAALPLACSSSSSTTPVTSTDAATDGNTSFQLLDSGIGAAITIQGQGTVSGGGNNLPDGAPIYLVYCTNVDAAMPAIQPSDGGPCFAPVGTTVYAVAPPAGGWVFSDWAPGANSSTTFLVDDTTGPTLTAVFKADDASVPDAGLPTGDGSSPAEDGGEDSASPTPDASGDATGE